MTKTRESHKRALRELLDRHGIEDSWRRGGQVLYREKLIEEILLVNHRFTYNPGFDEALNSGDGTYKP